jgi:ParB family chromosome partitioning protein
MEKRLGRGLGSLLSTKTTPRAPGASEKAARPSLATATPPEPGPGPAAELPLASIRPNPHQPRDRFTPDALAELEASIRVHGVLQPIVVRAVGDGFEIIAGERRWRASQAAGLKAIPAIVRDGVEDREMLELALIENLQRADLDPIEKARGFRELVERGLSQDQVAKQVGLQRSTVANFLRLLELAEPVQKAVTEGLISMGHARALLGVSDPRRQQELCALIARKGLSVRDAERRVRELQGRSTEAAGKVIPKSAPPWVRDMETRIRTHLGTKVQVRNGEGYRGQIVIEYHGREDLDRVFAILAPRKTL